MYLPSDSHTPMPTIHLSMKPVKLIISNILLCLLIVELVPAAHAVENGKSPAVQTTKGKVQGLRETFKGQKYDVFKGIPYAAPPVGSLRFKRPQEAQSWDGVRNTTAYGLGCTQVATNDSGENCLYLNVYVPKGVGNVKSLPVMVWAHGGGFFVGSSDIYKAQELALTGGVIVITFNYRLSSLGGLATRNAAASGNYMLWDARAVLIWIQSNIANFGGDKSRVTAFGQSAGAALTSHLAISPMTKGLLHRAIALSGNAASTIGIQYDSRKNAQNLALYEDCPRNDMGTLVKCLRKKHAKDVDVSGLASLVVEGGVMPGWLPAIDGIMVPDIPRKMWENGAGSHVDYLVGRTEHDCAGFVYVNIRGEPRNESTSVNIAEDKEVLQVAMNFLLQSYARGDSQVLVDIVKTAYPDIDSNNVLKRTQAVSRLSTDFIFAAPAHFEAMHHARNSKSTGKKTFLYNFKYRPSFTHYASWIMGSHADDVHFVFGDEFRKDYRKKVLGEWSTEDHTVKSNMMAYLTNFAHTGDPNKGPLKAAASWPEYNNASKQYMEISAKLTAKKEEASLLSRYNFWLKEWPRITVAEKP